MIRNLIIMLDTYFTPLFTRRQHQLYKWMAGMLRNGYPLPNILESLANTSDKYKDWLLRMASQVREGHSLSKSMQKEKIFVHPVIKAFIEVGEKHDILPQTLTLACEINDSEKPREQKIVISEFILYITSTVLIVCSLLIVILIFVIPVFQDMFAALGAQLPGLTQVIINFSNWVKQYFLYLIVATWISVVFISYYPCWLYRWERVYHFLEALPLAGRIFRYSRLWKIFYGLGSLLQMGLPLDEAVAVMGKGLHMPILVKNADRISARLGQGIEPADAISKEKIFPDCMRWAIGTSETSGDIPNTLIKVGTMYRELKESLLTRFVSVAYLLFTMIIIGIVGVVVISIYLPIFTMAGAV